MRLRDWLLRLAGGDAPGGEQLPSRRARRATALRRHREADAPAWPPDERHENPDPGREVSDLVPGWPGSTASRRWLGRRRR